MEFGSMPQLINSSPVAIRVRAHRIRSTIRRQLEVIHRSESLSENEIDDETFPELLDEIVSDLNVGKDAVADALDVNLATLYRWLKRKNLPLAFARPTLLGKLANLLRANVDASETRLLDDRRASVAAAHFDIPGDAVQFLASAAPKGPSVVDEVVLYPFEGPFGELTHGNDRPTFAAFAWRGVGVLHLTPAAAIAEAYVSVTTPGMSYFCHRTQQFVPIHVSDHVGQLLAFIAKDAAAPALPPIILRSSGGATAFGTMVLTSGHGVPYDVVYHKNGKAVCIHPLLTNPADPPPLADTLTIAIPRNAEAVPLLDNLVQFLVPTGTNQSLYDHARALELNNFEVYQDRRYSSVRGAKQDKNSGTDNLQTYSGVAARIVVFGEGSERFSRYATHICRHKGAELIVPLYGAVDAHLINPDSETYDAHTLIDRHELQLGEVVGDGELYEPCVLLGPSEAHGQAPVVLALNPDRILHGFTGLSRRAALLALTVRNVGKRDGWAARSMVDCVPDGSKIVHL